MKGRILDHVVAAARDHRSLALATNLATGRQLLLDGDHAEGDLTLEDAALVRVREAWRAGRNRTIETAAGPVFVEVLTPPRRCFVIGAVHIAQPLVKMLAMADYAVTVIDPRESFATEARFPGLEMTSEWPDEALERLRPDRGSALVALTHDPKLDDPALAAALRSECFYVGALGSRRNHAGRCARLKELGFSDRDVARIHGPIGLPIGAISPAEVAISILAEMTQILRQGEAAGG
ncbi:MAG TPA: XdhC family protein [Stellaceae bacterium]|jgi:xanthine dehydrogenase accessory factor|nr:XdhC family protein [Stellaceae bacterium]